MGDRGRPSGHRRSECIGVCEQMSKTKWSSYPHHLRDGRQKLLTNFPQYHLLSLEGHDECSLPLTDNSCCQVSQKTYKQFITVPKEVENALISQWGKAGKCSQTTEDHTLKQRPAQEGQPAGQTWQLEFKPQSSTSCLSKRCSVHHRCGRAVG